jgi:DNA-binding XRE family transcriptional regulator
MRLSRGLAAIRMKILKNSDFMRGLCYKGFMEPEYEFLPFGPALRRLRRAVGLTQEALADLVEVDQTTISNWEKRRCLEDECG